MKKLLLILCCISVYLSYSQNDTNDAGYFNAEAEYERAKVMPKSPQVWAFSQFEETPVDMYRGVPTISIPLHTISGKEMNLPISISYDPLNLKVEGLASSLGFGWSLNAGGAIVTQVNGLSDKNTSGGGYLRVDNTTVKQFVSKYVNNTFNNASDIDAFYGFLKDLSDNDADALPDLYTMNVNGENLEFAYDMITSQMICLNDPKISSNDFLYPTSSSGGSGGSWEVESNGFTYVFGKPEITRITDTADNSNDRSYVSSWFITKIVSPNGRDVFEFTYYDSPSYTSPLNFRTTSKVYQETYNSNNSISEAFVNEVISTTKTKIDQVALSTIKHNGNTIVDFVLASRLDLDSNDRIERVNIFNHKGDKIKEILFDHTYFGVPIGQTAQSQSKYDIKLKLDSLNIISNNPDFSTTPLQSQGDRYTFEYKEPENVPGILSEDQDDYGYYSTSSSFKFDKATKGILNKMSIPTGGYLEYEYEQARTDYYTPRRIQYGRLLSEEEGINGVTCYENPLPNSPPPPCEPCEGSNICPSDSPRRYDTKVFNVNEDGIYDLVFSLAPPVIGSPYPNSDEVTAYIVELDTNTPLSLDQLITACENGTDVVWSLHGCESFDPNSSTNSCQDMELELKNEKFYQMLIINDAQEIMWNEERDGPFVNYELEISRIEDRINETDYYPSYRIDKVLTYERDGALALLTDYDLGDIKENNTIKESIVKSLHVEENKPVSEMMSLNSRTVYTKPILKPGSVLNYRYGNKKQIDFTDIDSTLTMSSYRFKHENQVGMVPAGGAPFPNSYYSNVFNGKLITKNVYRENEPSAPSERSLISKNENNYSKNSNKAVFGLTVKNNPINNHRVIRYYSTSGVFTYELIDKEWRSFGSGTQSVLQEPINCSNGTWQCSTALNLNLEAYPTVLQGNYGYQTNTLNTNYLDNGIVTDSRAYSYNVKNLITSEERLLSDGTTKKSTYIYEDDPTYLNLVSSLSSTYHSPSFINDPVMIVNEIDGAHKNSQLKLYRKLDTTNTGGSNPINTLNGKTLSLLAKVKTSKTGNYYHDELFFDKYDDQGNLLQSSDKSGVKTSYIWSYSGNYLVAKIVNVAYDNIPQTHINAINGATSESTLLTGLNALRNDSVLNNGQITTYTYNPGVGITSITDPRDYIMYYEYDEFNRLKHVKDLDGNVLSKNEYNYRPQN